METVPGITMEDMEREATINWLDGFRLPELEPHMVTSGDLQRMWGWTEPRASRFLKKMERKGKLEAGDRFDPRCERDVRAYWKKTKVVRKILSSGNLGE